MAKSQPWRRLQFERTRVYVSGLFVFVYSANGCGELRAARHGCVVNGEGEVKVWVGGLRF